MTKVKPKAKRGSDRREDALSHARIVDAAIALLDADGEEGLTFRALSARLETGAGAIYWHVENKGELLVAASDAVIAGALAGVGSHAAPKKAIRSVAVCIFEAVDAHPWLGAQLSKGPWQTAMLQIFERIGQQLQALGAPAATQFTAASALVNYIIGVSSQNAAQRLQAPPHATRAGVLAAEAARWKGLDAGAFPFTRHVANQLRVHDDRDEFLAGVDLILAGIASRR